eukprot:TRINITY_DN11241_c0_g1_i1.p2 TRINITY_DN11241_c0_g1~~TRINITY_DN11241_c0_g1_i1.p2  ORF type:complete len:61 (-),score=13.86 TRINITY_DN11241_c0_g1_i1:147-329(-)
MRRGKPIRYTSRVDRTEINVKMYCGNLFDCSRMHEADIVILETNFRDEMLVKSCKNFSSK